LQCDFDFDQVGLLWQGPGAIVRVNYRPIIVRKQKCGRGLQMGARHQERLCYLLLVVN
jgi:hypothetical protein